MLLAQIFKTFEGARKRARFENVHRGERYTYEVTRCINGKPDPEPFSRERFAEYNYRLERKPRK